jgi:hypothetical protein
MFARYTKALLYSILIVTSVYGQSNYKMPKFKRVSQTYGYLIGQQYSLNMIIRKFPELEIHVLRAQFSFNSTFGISAKKIKEYLIDYLGQNTFNQFDDELITEIKKSILNETLTKELATNFISEVEERARGNITSVVLETLLSFQYFDRPQDELLQGFTKTFKTKGHPKSKNTDWEFKIPLSWKADEADRPNIIQKFVSDYGNGNQSIMILVKEIPLPKGHKISSKEINDLFTENEMREMIPENGKYVSFTKMTIDNQVGGMLECEQLVKRLDFTIKIRIAQFMFVRDNNMYILQGTVGSEQADVDLSHDMRKYLPLYKLVINSVLVNDQYK